MTKKKKLNGFQLKQQKEQLRLNKIDNQRESIYSKNKITLTKEWENLQEKYFSNVSVKNEIRRDDITHDDFFKGKEIKFVMNDIEKIPLEIVDKVNEIIDTKIFYHRNCWWNSSTISEDIEGVEKVDGWVGFKRNFKKISFLEKRSVEKLDSTFKDSRVLLKDYGNGYKVYDTLNGEDIFDCRDKNREFPMIRHSWNRYNGVDFDVSTLLYRKNILNDGKGYHTWGNYVEYDTDSRFKKIDKDILTPLLDFFHHPNFGGFSNSMRLN